MIVTFYSYKGGVGRSMAMANVAKWLQQQGLRVVIVDWDLEAPGIESFFVADEESRMAFRSKLGLIDLLLSYKEAFPHLQPAELRRDQSETPGAGAAAAEHLDTMVSILEEALPPLSHLLAAVGSSKGEAPGSLSLLGAGRRDEGHFNEYANAVQRFDWNEFYAAYEGEAYFEWMRRQLLDPNLVDVVLIDSRTGVAEMSGACTRQLADVVVLLSAPNDQNLDGVAFMAESFTRQDVLAARGDRKLELVMVPARIDVGEGRPVDLFHERFDEKLTRFLPKAFLEADTSFHELRIPYVSAYAYSERLAVGDPEGVKAMQDAYQALALHLALLAPNESLLRSRCAQMLKRRFRLGTDAQERIGGEEALARAKTTTQGEVAPSEPKALAPTTEHPGTRRYIYGAVASFIVVAVAWLGRSVISQPTLADQGSCGAEPRDCSVVLGEANALVLKGQPSEARIKYGLVGIAADNPKLRASASMGMAALYLKEAQAGTSKAENQAKARQELEGAVAALPAEDAIYALAVLQKEVKYLAAARASVEKGLTLNGASPWLLALRAELSESQNDFKSANADYQSALVALVAPQPVVFTTSWADVFYGKQPDQSALRVALADNLVRLGNTDAALVAYDRAIGQDDGLWEARFSRASLLLKQAGNAKGAHKKWLTRRAVDDLVRVADGADTQLADSADLQLNRLKATQSAAYVYYFSPKDELSALSFAWKLDEDAALLGMAPQLARFGSPQADLRTSNKVFLAGHPSLAERGEKIRRIASEVLGVQLTIDALNGSSRRSIEVRLGVLPAPLSSPSPHYVLVDRYEHALAAGRLDEAAFILNGLAKGYVARALGDLSSDDLRALYQAAAMTLGVGEQSAVALVSKAALESPTPVPPKPPTPVPPKPPTPVPPNPSTPVSPKPKVPVTVDEAACRRSVCGDPDCEQCIGIDDGYEGSDKIEQACWVHCLERVEACKCGK